MTVYARTVYLLFLNILQRVKGNRSKNDNSREHELQIGIDAQDGQRVRQSGKEKNARCDTRNLTDAAGK